MSLIKQGNGELDCWGDEMIPVKNIYYMLAYAWENTLKQDGESPVDSEAFDNIYNLLTSILIQDVKRLIKSGFARGYIDFTEEMPIVRGKINLNNTIKGQTLTRKQLVCEYDDFSENILLNRIIKSTMAKLVSCPELDKKYKGQCKVLLRSFAGAEEIDIGAVSWGRLNFTRNNHNYRLIINVCQLIHTGLITTEEKGSYKFATFIKDRAMAKLYEKFVLNFYKRELTGYKAYSSVIDWQLDELTEDNLLPIMRTDIELESLNHKVIIDTKYYHNALTKSNLGETKTLISANLYQIFAYVKNSKFNGQVSGMLLYPTVDYELEQKYKMGGNDIYVNTVNLGLSFDEIKSRLLQIAEF